MLLRTTSAHPDETETRVVTLTLTDERAQSHHESEAIFEDDNIDLYESSVELKKYHLSR